MQTSTQNNMMHFAGPLLIVVVAALCPNTLAFPSGAGSCSAGNNAVQGSHLSNPTTGSLADGGFTVSLAGAPFLDGAPGSFSVNTDVELTVTGGIFTGFLLRLGETEAETDTAFSFTGADVQTASACADVGGVTHTSNSDKTMISATLNMADVASDMPLDVTVVVKNDNGDSEYYYSQFLLTAEAAVAVPVTVAPVVPPTQFPTAIPPTQFPTAIPPTQFPTGVTSSPVSSTSAPVVAPVAETSAPDATGTTMAPEATDSPVAAGTAAPFPGVVTSAPVTSVPETAAPSPTTTTSTAPVTLAPVGNVTGGNSTLVPTSTPSPIMPASGSTSAGVNAGVIVTAAYAFVGSMIMM